MAKSDPKEFQIVWILDDVERAFTGGLLRKIEKLWEEGESLEFIAEKFHRDPDEIFLALFDLARKGKITRPFGVRTYSEREVEKQG